jgi:hypothetical protein
MTMTANSHRLGFEPLEDRLLLATCHVTRLGDFGMGKAFRGDFRYCINKVNVEPGPDIIDFNVTGTINLTRALPDLSTDIDIQGPGADLLTVRRNTIELYRIFTVPSTATVQLSGLTISNGEIFSGGDEFGGGIYNAGVLTIRGCTVTGNDVLAFDFAYGGGIYNAGELTVTDSTIESNTVQASASYGGGIANIGTAWISSSTVRDNHVSLNPGESGYGGGLSNTGALSVINSTIDSNQSFQGVGGGIFINDGSTTIRHTTIAGNFSSERGGGIYVASNAVHMEHTIVALNVTNEPGDYSADIWGELSTSLHNLVGVSSGGSGYSSTDILDVDPVLGELEDNGGPTRTRALLPGSPAVNAGDANNAPEWDQRGVNFPRVAGGAIDIGAFEAGNHEMPASMGLLTPWRSDERQRFVNTGDATVETEPTYWDAFPERRRLVSAHGFTEGEHTNVQKQPFDGRRSDSQPSAALICDPLAAMAERAPSLRIIL